MSNPPKESNFTITTGRVTNALLTACLVLGGVIWNGITNNVKELQIEIKGVKSDISLLVTSLNEKGLNIEVNKERLNSVEKRVEALERKVGMIYSNKKDFVLFKPEEEIKLKPQNTVTWTT